jgi:hypothetical protein
MISEPEDERFPTRIPSATLHSVRDATGTFSFQGCAGLLGLSTAQIRAVIRGWLGTYNGRPLVRSDTPSARQDRARKIRAHQCAAMVAGGYSEGAIRLAFTPREGKNGTVHVPVTTP